jgi:transposase
MSSRGIYKLLRRYEEDGTVDRRPGSGRTPVKLPRRLRNRLVKAAVGRIGQSTRKLARKFNISKSYVAKTLNSEGIIYKKRKDAPKVTADQNVRQADRVHLLAEFCRQKKKTEFVLDDEAYFTLTGAQNEGFYVHQDDVNDIPDSIRLKYRQKFGPKVLLWAAVSKRGVSSLCLRPSRSEALNASIYIRECLQEHLLPYLKEKYPKGHYVFWPDLASCHYAKATLEWLNAKKIPFITKDMNPPNAPQIRPIERFWAHLKGKVYESGWTAENEDQLMRRIKKKAKEFSEDYFSNLFSNFKDKIYRCAKDGFNSLL